MQYFPTYYTHGHCLCCMLYLAVFISCNVPSINMLYFSCDSIIHCVQAHNPVDDVREGIKEGFSNLKHEIMVGTGLLIVWKLDPQLKCTPTQLFSSTIVSDDDHRMAFVTFGVFNSNLASVLLNRNFHACLFLTTQPYTNLLYLSTYQCQMLSCITCRQCHSQRQSRMFSCIPILQQ